MLWIVGSLILIAWFVAKFIAGKGGMVHTMLMAAITLYVIQFVQDHRTRAYYREQNREGK